MRYTHLVFACLCHAVLAQSVPQSTLAETNRTPEAQALFEQRQATMLALAVSYTGVRERDNESLTPLDKPLQRWTNPLIGIEHGLLVGWKDSDGRPMAVAQVYQWPSNQQWLMEHQSLTPDLMTFKSTGNPTWRPRKPGIVWRKLNKKAPKPATSKPLRLAQLKSISRRFSARDTKGSLGDRSLRLLSTPSMRYAVERDGILEGALFTFVSGTDPDVLLMLELRQDTQDTSSKPNYFWTFAPMSTGKLAGYLDGKEVWRHHEQQRSPDTAFFPHPLVAPRK